MTFVISHPASNDQIYVLSNPEGATSLAVQRIEVSSLAAGSLPTVTIDRVSAAADTAVSHNVLHLGDSAGPLVPQWEPYTSSAGFAGIQYVASGSPLILPFPKPVEVRNAHQFLYLIQGADDSNYLVNLWCDEF